MSSNNDISSNLVIDETDASISSMNNNIASTIPEVVITDTNTNAEGNENTSIALLQEPTTKNIAKSIGNSVLRSRREKRYESRSNYRQNA